MEKVGFTDNSDEDSVEDDSEDVFNEWEDEYS